MLEFIMGLSLMVQGWILVAMLTGLCFGLAAFFGAPWVPIRQPDTEKIFDLAQLKPGDTLIDLGSGDGRVLHAAAKRGIKAIGYEINPALVLFTYLRTWKYRRLVTLKCQSYWKANLPKADAIYTFLLTSYMGKLEKKLDEELRTPTKVVSYIFELPSKKPTKVMYNMWLYEFGKCLPKKA